MNKILRKIDREWDEIGFNVEDYTSLIHVHHKDYYDLLYNYVLTSYTYGRQLGEVRVNHATTKLVTKSEPHIFEKDKLWGTIPETRTRLKDMTFTASDKTMARVESNITEILNEGYSNGENSRVVGKRIKKEFSRLKNYEADRIARTEIHSAHEKGIYDQYLSMDVQYKRWNANIDNRTRSSHLDIDGEITSIHNTFTNGLQYPGDKNGEISEWIHCRCTESPFLLPLDKQVPSGMTHFREEDLLTIEDPLADINIEDAILGNWKKDKVKETVSQTITSSTDFISPSQYDDITEEGWKSINKFIQKRKNNKIEFGLIFDAKTGKLVSPTFRGARGSVKINPREMYRDVTKLDNLVTIHNHPASGFSAPSGADIKILMTNNKNINTSKNAAINISKNETWIFRTFQKEFPIEEYTYIEKEVNNIFIKTNTKIHEEVGNQVRKLSPKLSEADKIKEIGRISDKAIIKGNKQAGDEIIKFINNSGLNIHIERIPNKKISKSLKSIKKKKPSKIKKPSKKSPVARAQGAKVQTRMYGEGDEKGISEILYKDGTKIKFKAKSTNPEYPAYTMRTLEEVKINGKTYKFLDDDCYDFFKYQDKVLSKEEKIFVDKFANKYAQYEGMLLNNSERGKMTKAMIKKEESRYADFKWLRENYKKYNKLVGKSEVKENIATVRVQRKNYAGTDAKIIKDKSFTSTTVGTPIDELDSAFGGPDSWTYINVVPDGTKGARFQGNSLNRMRGADSDWEAELTWKQNQKFNILLRDDVNKIMILQPK